VLEDPLVVPPRWPSAGTPTRATEAAAGVMSSAVAEELGGGLEAEANGLHVQVAHHPVVQPGGVSRPVQRTRNVVVLRAVRDVFSGVQTGGSNWCEQVAIQP
jgi:hypothetical protein